MPNAKRPSGPGRPTLERRDAVAEKEELEELARGDGLDTPEASAAPKAATKTPRAKAAPKGAGRAGKS